ARRVHQGFGHRFRRLLGAMLKDREATGLTGATTLALGFMLPAVLVPGTPALAGVLIAGLADPAAGLAGRRARRLRYPGGKSVAGSVTFFIVALGITLALGLGPVVSLVVAVLVTVVESFSFRIDDNLYVPLAAAWAVALSGHGGV
ncbi:MAG: hypothetical protein ACOC5I_02210, partial [Gemmatimonadota bacterium]